VHSSDWTTRSTTPTGGGSRRTPGRALLHRVDPYVGLTEADFTVIRQRLAR
jgi:hypothetical protein